MPDQLAEEVRLPTLFERVLDGINLAAGAALMLAFLNLTIAVGLMAAADWISQPEPESPHTYPIHMRGSY
jgi:hypothetical protein